MNAYTTYIRPWDGWGGGALRIEVAANLNMGGGALRIEVAANLNMAAWQGSP